MISYDFVYSGLGTAAAVGFRVILRKWKNISEKSRFDSNNFTMKSLGLNLFVYTQITRLIAPLFLDFEWSEERVSICYDDVDGNLGSRRR